MSEIKGQLLGIILTLMVFGGVSATVAAVYSSSASKVSQYAEHIEEPAAGEVDYDTGNSGGAIAAPGQVAYPALHY